MSWTMLMGCPTVDTHLQDCLKSVLKYFHINTMSVAPLAISSFCTLFFLLSSKAVLPVKSLKAIILGCCFFFVCFGCTRT